MFNYRSSKLASFHCVCVCVLLMQYVYVTLGKALVGIKDQLAQSVCSDVGQTWSPLSRMFINGVGAQPQFFV